MSNKTARVKVSTPIATVEVEVSDCDADTWITNILECVAEKAVELLTTMKEQEGREDE